MGPMECKTYTAIAYWEVTYIRKRFKRDANKFGLFIPVMKREIKRVPISRSTNPITRNQAQL